MELSSLPDTILNHIYLFLTHKEIVCLSKLDDQFARIRKKFSISFRPADYQYALEIAAMEKDLREKLYGGEKLTAEEKKWFVPPKGFQFESFRYDTHEVLSKEEMEMDRSCKTGMFSLILYAAGEREVHSLLRQENIKIPTSSKVRISVTIGRNDIDPPAIIRLGITTSKFIGDRTSLPEFDPNSTFIGILGGVLSKIVSGAIQAEKEVEDIKRQQAVDKKRQISVENLQVAIGKCFPTKMKSFSEQLEKNEWKEDMEFFLRRDILATFSVKYPDCFLGEDANVVVRYVSKFLNFIAYDILNLVGKEAIVAKLRSRISSSENPFHRVQEDPEYQDIAQYHLEAGESENKNWLLNLELEGECEIEMDGRYKIVTESILLELYNLQSSRIASIADRHFENEDDIEGVLLVDDIIDDRVRLSLLETVNGIKTESLYKSVLGPSLCKVIIQELLADFDFELREWRFQNEILGLPRKEEGNDLFYNNLETLFSRCIPYLECAAAYDVHAVVNKIKPFPLMGKTLRVFCEIVESSNGYRATTAPLYQPGMIVASAEYVLKKDDNLVSQICFYRRLTDIEKNILKEIPVEILKEGNPCGFIRRETGQLIVSAQSDHVSYSTGWEKRIDNENPSRLLSILFWLSRTL